MRLTEGSLELETMVKQFPVDQEQSLVPHFEFIVLFSSKTFKVQVGL